MSSNDHFSVEDWIDFARDVCPVDKADAMRVHLHDCPPCREFSGFLKSLWQTGREMDSQPVPESWAAKAENILPERILRPLQGLPAVSALLAADSLTAAALQNVRGNSREERMLLFETPQCKVDLRLAEGLQGTLSLVGQIRGRRESDAAVSGTPVFLLARGRVVASAPSNEFGEFQMMCRPRRKMQISFPFEGSRVDIDLAEIWNKEPLG